MKTSLIYTEVIFLCLENPASSDNTNLDGFKTKPGFPHANVTSWLFAKPNLVFMRFEISASTAGVGSLMQTSSQRPYIKFCNKNTEFNDDCTQWSMLCTKVSFSLLTGKTMFLVVFFPDISLPFSSSNIKNARKVYIVHLTWATFSDPQLVQIPISMLDVEISFHYFFSK